MPLWRIYYHIVWTTKNRLPLIRPELERPLHGQILSKAVTLRAIVHGIGGMADHIHVVATIPPSFSVAAVVRQLKGASSRWMNEQVGSEDNFGWQRGYGVFSLGASQLQTAVGYVKRQKEHHRDGTLMKALEQVFEVDEER